MPPRGPVFGPDWLLHVESCPACQSLMSVASAIRAEAGEASRQADPPPHNGSCFRWSFDSGRKQPIVRRGRLRWMARVGVLAGMVASLAAVYAAAREISSALRSSESIQLLQPLGLLIPTTMAPLILLMTCVLKTLWAED